MVLVRVKVARQPPLRPRIVLEGLPRRGGPSGRDAALRVLNQPSG